MPKELFIGLMSGTSIDSIDAGLLEINHNEFLLLESHNHEIPTELKSSLETLCTAEKFSVDEFGGCDRQLGELFADATIALLHKAGLSKSRITAIGSHGQTVRHRPTSDHNGPFTLQIGDPNIIALKTGITTVADFRRKDMAAGGQAAPLAPVFHQAFFSDNRLSRAVINIGGISNLSKLSPIEDLIGFDLGPGNRLMDAWSQRHLNEEYDKNGHWAAAGTVNRKLLTDLLAHPYLSLKFPKSTGREDFNIEWLDTLLTQYPELEAQSVQATLLEFTAESIASATLEIFTPDEIYICGGGALNTTLMKRIQALFGEKPVQSTQSLGIDPQWVEAAGFAWLAKRRIENLTGNCTTVTGATKELTLGGIYLAD
jgi:anhydro-N-acetylmuramic acid kinase